MPTLVLTLYKSHLNDKWCKVWTFSLLSKAIQFYNHIHTHFRGFQSWVIPPGNIYVHILIKLRILLKQNTALLSHVR